MATRRILLTGAAGGLGLSMAAVLAEAGYSLVLLDRAPGVADQAAELRGQGFDASHVLFDLADMDRLPAMTASLAERQGTIDILINNAGIGLPGAHGRPPVIADVSGGDWARVLAVNLTAPMLLCQALLPAMADRGWGRIVNISSRAGRTSVPASDVAYAATKAGIIGLTRRLALEVAAQGITVNAIAPGHIDTALARQSSAPGRSTIPVGRVGLPAEVAAAVRYLIGEDAGYTTGAVLDVNGGAFIG